MVSFGFITSINVAASRNSAFTQSICTVQGSTRIVEPKSKHSSSSLRLTPRSRLEVFEDYDFEGKSLSYPQSEHRMNSGWNDRISSARLEEGSDEFWILHKDKGYKNTMGYICQGVSHGHLDPNDELSSCLKLLGYSGSGPYIALFKQPNYYGGNHLGMSKSVPTLWQWNFENAASCLLVTEGNWRVWTKKNYQGDHWDYGPGSHPDIGNEIGYNCINSVELLEE